jgi:glycosyltransferase involved in cell wall biosynthesis
LGELAWQRAAFGHGAWSLCGITHTLSSGAAMDALTQLLTAPTQPWDALICTSTVARDTVRRIWETQGVYLRDRLGAQRLVLPKLPVIPLGIHTQDFVHPEARRTQARHVLGADENTLVVLFAGRLSFHAKAHPLAMYQALERAAGQLPAGKNVLLVECGRHANEAVARAFADAARLACPSVRVLSLDGREGANYQHAWAGADVFCSLSDNLQETFGLTPIEAMATGLPVVVSDWDGYKDTVRDGIDGFRIPTLMPQAGMGADLASRHALGIDTYDMYSGHTCSLVAVDVEAAAQAFSRLFASSALRRQMGEAGRQRAREVFDWSALIPRYEALWAELAELRRVQAPALKPSRHPWPARMDPFRAFSSFPSQTLTPQTVLALVDVDVATASLRLAGYRQLAMVNFADAILPGEAEIQVVLENAAHGPSPAAHLIEGLPAPRRLPVLRALAWLVKLNVLRVSA